MTITSPAEIVNLSLDRPARSTFMALPNFAFLDHGGAASGAAGPASAPVLSLSRGPPGRTPGRTLTESADQDRSSALISVQRKGRLPRHLLSSSRPPHQGRPTGVARGDRQSRPLTRQPLTWGGSYEEDGGGVGDMAGQGGKKVYGNRRLGARDSSRSP